MKRQMLLRLWTVAVAAAPHAFAGMTMPWNTSFSQLAQNITGPTALTLVTLGAAAHFAPVVFHGEISHFVHKGALVFLVGGAIAAAGYIGSLIVTSGALV